MRSYQLSDGTTITTPIYVGTAAMVEKATTCKHEFHTHPEAKIVQEEEEGPGWIVIQCCRHCVAMRVRSGPTRESLLTLVPEEPY